MFKSKSGPNIFLKCWNFTVEHNESSKAPSVRTDKWPVGKHLHWRVKGIYSDRHTLVIDDHPIVTERLLERMSRMDPVIDQRTKSTCNHVALHK
jgi:hypothetical protein